jgi:glycine/D-amino acid oxidase-like deaminating enzyme
MTRVAVVGAGVVGAAIARALAQAGNDVTLIDGRPGGIASRGSFAWLNAASAEDDGYCVVRQRAIALWRALAGERRDCPVAFPGMLFWELPPDALEVMARRLGGLGHPAELVDRLAVARLQPGLSAPEVALWLPTEGRAEPRAIADWFARAAAEAGATLVPERVTGIAGRAGSWELRLGTERIATDELVIAAGVATPELLAPLGHDLALRTEPGLLVRTEPAPSAVGAVLGSPEVHFWQAEDGTVLAGSDYGGRQRFDEPASEARAMLDAIAPLVAGLGRLEAAEILVTDRPMLPDDRPAVGRLAEGLCVAVTHSGMTLAPLIAEAIAAEIAGGAPDPMLESYRPDRLAVAGSAG